MTDLKWKKKIGMQPCNADEWANTICLSSFSEPEAHRHDVPKAQVRVLDAGHFALDTAADQIAQLVRDFMK
jgi:hypothetical protein